MNLRKFIKPVLSVVLAGSMMFSMAACGATGSSADGSTGGSENKAPIVLVWYPNESADDYAPARDEFGKLIEEATGRKVEQKLTTDYAIAIESIANGTASICFMGAQGYIEANKKSDSVKPLFVNSGASGTLDDAIYYSYLNVNDGEEVNYKNGDEFSIDNIPGKKISFVSNSSTSGFKVPTASILGHFSKTAEWSKIDIDMLIEGGDDMFFSEVLFGGSHQGSAVNLLSGKAEIAAFCDTEIAPYADVVSGTKGKAGVVYQIKDDASAPFDAFKGERMAVIQSTPVLNGPFAYNKDTLSSDEVTAIQELFTSDEVANNDKIFVTEESGGVGMFEKSDNERFVLVEDSWFDPIRELEG